MGLVGLSRMIELVDVAFITERQPRFPLRKQRCMRSNKQELSSRQLVEILRFGMV